MSNYDDDAEIIAAARAGFLDEAADMLAQFEQALLVMETAPDDAENLNAAFRAAHTIKGTAGLFGCDAVVLFTHEVETLLEGLRSGQQQVNDTIIAALLQGRDQIEALIDEVRSGQTDPDVAARSASLGAEIRALYGGETSDTPGGSAASGSGHVEVWIASGVLSYSHLSTSDLHSGPDGGLGSGLGNGTAARLLAAAGGLGAGPALLQVLEQAQAAEAAEAELSAEGGPGAGPADGRNDPV